MHIIPIFKIYFNIVKMIKQEINALNQKIGVGLGNIFT